MPMPAAASFSIANATPALETYLKRSPASAAAHRRAESLLPGGTSRQAGYWAPYPLTFDRAEGVYLWDIDGHRYFDLINNYTAMVHGHAYPPIVEAAQVQAARGTGWAGGNTQQLDLAEQLVARPFAILSQ